MPENPHNGSKNMKKLAGKAKFFLIFAFAWIFVCVQCNSIPFYANPSVLAGSWVAAFGESIFNSFPPSLYSRNFGFPSASPMVFGLSGALPAGALIHCGIHPTDAYTIVFSLWLGVALLGAWKLARCFGVGKRMALLGAVFWCSLPIIRGSSELSMLGIGFALIPTYFLILHVLYQKMLVARGWAKIFRLGICNAVLMIFSLFTDGYSFIMLVCINFLFIMYLFYHKKECRKRILLRVIPVAFIGILISYVIYISYVGVSTFPYSPLAVFRAHGLDLFSLIYTVRGSLWFPDLLHTNISTHKIYFGEYIHWSMFYSVPLFGFTILCFVIGRKNIKNSLVLFFLILSLAGLYLSLGPSLKINAHVKSENDIANHRLMDEKFAPISTGSAVLWENIPGFKNLRVTSRIALMFFFGIWAADMVILGGIHPKNNKVYIIIGTVLAICIILNTPGIGRITYLGRYCRNHHFYIDRDFVEPLGKSLDHKTKLAVLPHGGDFIANYISARLNIKTYNTGQDKALGLAMQKWPSDFPRFSFDNLSESQKISKIGEDIVQFLRADPDRVVLLPLIDFGWASMSAYRTDKTLAESVRFREEAFLPLLGKLKKFSELRIERGKTYIIIRNK